MNIEDIGLLTSFFAGIVSFLSPCILPIAVGYITYITGTIVEEELEGRRLFALKRTIAFTIGFTIVFMIFGVSAGILGRFLIENRDILNKISGGFIVLMGLSMMGLIKIKSPIKYSSEYREVNSELGSLAIGMAFGIGWTPCVGPILGTILFYAGREATSTRGALLLFMYSVGLSIPFILTSIFVDRISNLWKKISKYTHILMRVSGILIIILGLIIFFDKMYLISNLGQ